SITTNCNIHETDSADRKQSPSASEMLIAAMLKNPPEVPGQILDRIDEAHAINCSHYINAIIELISEPSSLSKSTDQQVYSRKYKPNMMTMAVCERLLEAICNTEVNGISLRIDWHIVQDLYNIAKSKGWELDSEVLQNTAIYLANSSFYTVSKAVKLVNSASLQEQSDRDSIWSFNLNGQEICDISLSRVMRQAKTVL
ncbi:hypothetical protein J3B02_006509, partial [Coemansia erecta]